MLDQLLTDLTISGSPSRAKDVHFTSSNDTSVMTASGSDASEFESFVEALNKLQSFQLSANIPQDLDDFSLKSLLAEISSGLTRFQLQTITDRGVAKILQIVALLRASFQINDLIKGEISTDLIDQILNIYLDALDVFKHMAPTTTENLLRRTSFISPLLVTISFSYKLQYSKSTSLLKILSILFCYHIMHISMLEEVVKMFSVNGSTNMDVFDVFNKLWKSTLESQDEQSLDVRHAAGPISLLNRIEVVKDMEIGIAVLDQIVPFSPNELLSKLAKDTVYTYNCLISLGPASTTAAFLPLLDVLKTEMGCEVVLSIIGSLQLESLFLSFLESSDHKALMEYIFYRIGSTMSLCGTANPHLFFNKILNSKIIDALNESKYARYKMVFELIDHNYKTNFKKDFQMAVALESTLSAIDADFSLVDDHATIVEFGSSLSMEALFNYTTFIVESALLKFVNPSRELPRHFVSTMSLKKFAPLPRSNFLSFEVLSSVSNSQVNMKNFDRLVNSAHLSLKLMRTVIQGYINSKDYLKIETNLIGDELNIEYSAMHFLLEQYYTTLFTVLIVSYEMSTRSKQQSRMRTYMFHDYASSGNVLKLQVFQVFQDLFKLYGSYAVYELIRFVSNTSAHDLELQTFGVVLINHMTFHAPGCGFKEHLLQNQLIKETLVAFIETWDDGSALYSQLAELLGISHRKEFPMVPFPSQTYLAMIGFNHNETSTPSPGTSTHSNTNSIDYNNTNTTQASHYSDMSYQSTNLGYQRQNQNQHQFTNNNQQSAYSNPPKATVAQTNYLNPPASSPANYGYGNLSNFSQNNNAADYKSSNIRNVKSFVPKASSSTGYLLQQPSSGFDQPSSGFSQQQTPTGFGQQATSPFGAHSSSPFGQRSITPQHSGKGWGNNLIPGGVHGYGITTQPAQLGQAFGRF